LIKKFTTLFFLLIFSPFLVNAEVAKFVFTSTPQSVPLNQISEVLSIQAQDASGNSNNTTQTVCLSLTTTSSSGEFSSSNTNWNPVSVLTMNKGSANRNFYYKDTSSGNFSLSINAVPRPETETRSCASWPVAEWGTGWVATQGIAVGSGSTPSESQQVAQEPVVEVNASFGTGTASGEHFPVEPQIFASAGPDKVVIVGADEKFTGSSVGLNKEPLTGARYLWSFGDGSTGEGISVLHNYKYPGEYIVVLDIASGKYSASDRLIVKAVPNQLKISEINTEFIKLLNSSGSEINISNWFFRFSGVYFKIPETTIIRAKSELVIPNTVTGFKISSKSDLVELLYPNASPVSIYKGAEAIVPSINKVATVKTKVVSTIEAKAPEVNKTEATQNLASVIYTEQKGESGTNKWLLPTAGIGLLTALGYVSIKKQKQKEDLAPKNPGDDFIIEEDDKF